MTDPTPQPPPPPSITLDELLQALARVEPGRDTARRIREEIERRRRQSNVAPTEG